MGNICNQAPESSSYQINLKEGKNTKETGEDEEESEYQRFHDYIIVAFCSDGGKGLQVQDREAKSLVFTKQLNFNLFAIFIISKCNKLIIKEIYTIHIFFSYYTMFIIDWFRINYDIWIILKTSTFTSAFII